MAETTTVGKSDDKTMAAIATLPVVGLIMKFAMKDRSDLVEHYIVQSNVLLALGLIQVLMWVASIIPVIGLLIVCFAFILSIVTFVLWLVCVVQALQGQKFEIPVLTAPIKSLTSSIG